ncbi:nickel transporter [Methanomicrobiaceae archaeon CYW5]|uniref:HisA/HisF-related TIM barrel protein n=1 Tax=Methanovulcanius yangii TaxID=1789227 RepID=UPI0029CA8099|nr:HisA/HisF-related TIM barrel protein [Methanovulcanius yangii]MBT8507849.1 nickel transporter [Methanovulcanius yangii]
MDLILAIDLKDGQVVHGKGGHRQTYRPLDWAFSDTAEPGGFLKAYRPKYIYIADLDRIEGTGDNTDLIFACAHSVELCYADRGLTSPEEALNTAGIVDIIGTETAAATLADFTSGFVSLDIKDGHVIPSGEDPTTFLKKLNTTAIDGCIILNITSVGTGAGVDADEAARMRAAYDGTLIYGGGVARRDDLFALADAGYDGAIVATAVHSGEIPLEWVREGKIC